MLTQFYGRHMASLGYNELNQELYLETGPLQNLSRALPCVEVIDGKGFNAQNHRKLQKIATSETGYSEEGSENDRGWNKRKSGQWLFVCNFPVQRIYSIGMTVGYQSTTDNYDGKNAGYQWLNAQEM